jgi:Protein of unknown function (DUF3592)
MNRSFSPLVFIRLLFGGILNLMGYLFLLFGLVFVRAFDIPGTIDGFINFQGELAEVSGEVTAVNETSMYENDFMVYQIHFKYTELNGQSYENFSYSTNPPALAEIVIVEYNVANPYYSRIQGLRFSEAPVWVSFVLIFPLIGLIIALTGFAKGLVAAQLVRVGELTEGVLKSKSPTNVRINNQPVYKLTFEFRTRDGQIHQCISKTHQPYKLEDDQKEKILYDPKKPQKAVLLDAVPINLQIEGSSYVFSSSGGLLMSALNMILPLATVIFIYYIFF